MSLLYILFGIPGNRYEVLKLVRRLSGNRRNIHVHLVDNGPERTMGDVRYTSMVDIYDEGTKAVNLRDRPLRGGYIQLRIFGEERFEVQSLKQAMRLGEQLEGRGLEVTLNYVQVWKVQKELQIAETDREARIKGMF